jgi:hypothetical protein
MPHLLAMAMDPDPVDSGAGNVCGEFSSTSIRPAVSAVWSTNTSCDCRARMDNLEARIQHLERIMERWDWQ